MRKLSIISVLLLSALLLSACGKNIDHTALETEPKNAEELVEEWMADETSPETKALDSTEIDAGATPLTSFEYLVREDGTAAITKFTGTETDVMISSKIGEAPVTEISQYAFEAKWDVKSVQIPESVTKIGEFAFMDCEHLSTVNIPSGVTALYRGTFAGCVSLMQLTIPAAVGETAEELLTGCQLTDLYIENPDLTYVSWGLEDLDPPCTIHAPAGAAILKWAEENGFPTEST